MDQICVPAEALKNQEEFTKWFRRTKSCLFPFDNETENGIDSLKTYESIERKFYVIAKYFNLVFNGTDAVVDVRSKNKKHNCSTTDIIATSCYILMTRFNKMKCVTVAKILATDHSTVVYYKKRTKGMLMMRIFRSKYLRLISLLENERIIPTIETEEFKPQRILSPVLPEL